MKFNELQKGKIYTDKDGINAYQFKEIKNEQIATFYVCEYNEEKGDYVATEEIIYLVVSEVKNLI